MAQITVKDGTAVNVSVELPLAPGRAAAAASKPVAISTEDFAALGAVNETAPASDTASAGQNGRLQRIAQNITSLIAKFTLGAGTASAALRTTLASDDAMLVAGVATVVTTSTTISRPANTTQYTIGDAMADNTAAVGGSTLSGVVRATGKGGIINGLTIVSDNAPTTPLEGELWVFRTAVTAITDNAVFTVSDSEMAAGNLVAKIPFALTTIGANSSAYLKPMAPFTTTGTANLRFLVRVTNAYTPASAETLTVAAIITPVG